MPPESPNHVRVCILGAGPHALSMALHLVRADPALADQMAVIDPSGRWLSVWDQQFARLEIDVLRSPSVHHPAPDVDALTAFVVGEGLMSSGLPYDPPTTKAFRAFSHRAIHDAGLFAPLAARPRRIVHEAGGRVRIETEADPIVTDRLVVATNPHRRRIPDWVWPLCGTSQIPLAHAADIDLTALPDLAGERVAIIGGGLTAAHLALGAARRGAEVQLIARRALETRPFDTDPGWLGPKHLTGFERCEDPGERLHMARAAQGGGTLPDWVRSQLEHDGISLRECTEVETADPGLDAALLTLSGGERLRCQRIWLATGTTPDIRALRCLGPLLPDIATVDGLPIPDDDLRVGLPPVHVMGRLATLRLGPAAGNLWGARHAALRITEAITGIDATLRSLG